MLRDMEELLNNVCDLEIKEYLRESLNCYNTRSYRACVILAVIAGSFDLHRKVKALAKSNPKIRELDNNVEDKKNNSNQYERYLIEQCATIDIDILNEYEKKKLLRCLDIRNDSAHPSDYTCTAETARHVFSDIIDTLASKPILFGCEHMKVIIEEMKEATFFSVLEKERIKTTISEVLSRLHKKAVPPFVKLSIKTLLITQSDIHKDNLIRFLANLPYFIENDYEEYISELMIKDKNETILLELLSENIDIVEFLSPVSIDRIISKLEINLKAKKLSNKNKWIKVILSKKMQNKGHIDRIVKILCSFKKSTFPDVYDDKRYEFLYSILDSKQYTNDFLINIRETFKNLDFSLGHYENRFLVNIIISLNDAKIYQHWFAVISNSINSYSYDTANKAAYLFEEIPKSYWYGKVHKDSIVLFVEKIIITGNKEYSRPYSVTDLMVKLHNNYLELVQEFLTVKFVDEIDISKNAKDYLTEKSTSIIVTYIFACDNAVSEQIITNIMKHSIDVDLSNFKYYINERIESVQDLSIKSRMINLLSEN